MHAGHAVRFQPFQNRRTTNCRDALLVGRSHIHQLHFRYLRGTAASEMLLLSVLSWGRTEILPQLLHRLPSGLGLVVGSGQTAGVADAGADRLVREELDEERLPLDVH